MSYIIRQISGDFQNVNTQDEASLKYMTPITDGVVTNEHRLLGGRDFIDSGVYIQPGLKKGAHYYFYARVLKTEIQQDFNILLTTKANTQRQFINKLSVLPISQTEAAEYAEFEAVFTPAADFDTIVFELIRNEADAIISRTATVLFEELDIINNLLSTGVKASKITVQSTPGLLMCINGQEIRVGRTGVYELNNQALKITSFGIAAAGSNDNEPEVLESACLFNLNKTRMYPAFVLDYIYEQEG